TFTHPISEAPVGAETSTGTANGRASAAQQTMNIRTSLNCLGSEPGRYCPITSIVLSENILRRLSSDSAQSKSVTSSATFPSAAFGRYWALPSTGDGTAGFA